ncbi:MAG TPA: hypothetical protein VKS43_05570 [Burkholderiales bacterium]|nr:hypothetical protein [Burkholderiales bacterium]
MKSRTVHEALGLRFDRLSPAASVALACALAALWLLGRRYGGITHDATLYLVQGLRRLDPAAYGRELFFTHGAQDAYTLFPRLYAPIIGALGAGGAALAVTVAGQIAFFAAAAALVFRIARGLTRWWSLALLAAASGYYGGVGVFRIAEPFATARTLAEPLVLAALACTLSARPRTAFAALAMAGALHPLVAAPGVAAVYLWHAFERPRLLWLAPLFAVPAIVVAIGWPGFALRFDPVWLASVVERTPHLFLSQWPLPDWARLFWGFCIAGMARRFIDAPARRLVLAVLAVGLAGLAASWVAVDLIGSVFAAALQMWRTHWLVHTFAIILVPVVVAGQWRSGNAARAAAACIAASCCFGRGELPAAAVLVALALLLDVSERRRPGWMGERPFRLALMAILCTASVGLLFEVQSRLPLEYSATQAVAWTDYVAAAGTVGGLLPLAVLLLVAACSRFALAGLVAATVALAVGIAAWDARVPWSRVIEQAGAHGNPFRGALPPGAVVFWPGPHGPAWVALGTPTWFSVDQGAGVVFNRETAIEYDRRKRASRELRSSFEYCALAPSQTCRIDPQSVRALCELPDGPDYAVLNARIEGVAAVEWNLPPEIGPGRQALYLYACRDLMSKAEIRSGK